MSEFKLTALSCAKSIIKLKNDEILGMHFYLANHYMARRALVVVSECGKAVAFEKSMLRVASALADAQDFAILVDSLIDLERMDKPSNGLPFLDTVMHVSTAMTPSYGGDPTCTPDVFRLLLAATPATPVLKKAFERVAQSAADEEGLAVSWTVFEEEFAQSTLGERLVAMRAYHGKQDWLFTWMSSEFNADMEENMKKINSEGTFNFVK